MINTIKKGIFSLFLRAAGYNFGTQWNQVKRIKTTNDVSAAQKKYFEELLSHAYRNVSYYSKILKENNIAAKANFNTSELNAIPLLTKNIINRQGEALCSSDCNIRKWNYVSSGGSTGEPVRLVQDSLLGKWVRATLKYYYEIIVGIDELGVRKVLLWGSERDIFKGTRGLRAKTINWLENLKFLNSFMLTERDMAQYVKIINSYKPDLIRGYAGSLYELCKFIEKNDISVYQPKVVISAAETLRTEIRQKIECVFRTKVYDFYGSRETPAIAGECSAGLMHIFTFHNHLEVLDRRNMPIKEGEMGKIILTQLHNYSMPLIRYEIGDAGILGPETCKCGNPLPTLSRIMGRITDNFVKEDGTIIHGEYFTHLFYLKDWLKAFQVIQEDYGTVRVIIVLRNDINKVEKNDIEAKIKEVMGQDCTVIWEFVEKIPRTQSGKYLYTKSLLHPT